MLKMIRKKAKPQTHTPAPTEFDVFTPERNERVCGCGHYERAHQGVTHVDDLKRGCQVCGSYCFGFHSGF